MKIRVKSTAKKTAKPAKKTEKIKDKKPAKKTQKTAVVKGKAKAKKPIKSKKEIKEQKKPASKKPTLRKAEKEKKPAGRKKAVEKTVKKEPKKIALPAKKIAHIPHRTIEKIEKEVKGFAPAQEYGVAVTAKKALPVEYGEDRITLMTVDPWKLFAYWEVKENTLSKVKGTLVLRVYDVTGIYFDGKNANLVFDVPVFGRIGDSYIGVGPDKAFVVDIGAVSKAGEFVAMARSNQASTPALKVSKEEGALPEEIYEVGPVTGYF
ncbi:MAG: DUF4912 domain-containing protein [Nitrospiraceae bacterium]|nr:MAG: DUF4912 domain-containing protein [Nitrospiraceae bacterium]